MHEHEERRYLTHLKRLGARTPERFSGNAHALSEVTWRDPGAFSTPHRTSSRALEHLWLVRFHRPHPLGDRPEWTVIGETDGGNYALLMRAVDPADAIYLLDHEEPAGRPREVGYLGDLLSELIPSEAESEALLAAGYPGGLSPTFEIPSHGPKRVLPALQLARALQHAAHQRWRPCAEHIEGLIGVLKEPSCGEAEAFGRLLTEVALQNAQDPTIGLDVEGICDYLGDVEDEVNRACFIRPLFVALAEGRRRGP